MFDWVLTDPNLIFLALVFGLWLAVAAIYSPGTIVLETVSLGLLVGVILVLGTLPTNWLAVLLIVVGAAGFLTLPLLRHRLSSLAVVGLVLQAAGGLLLFNDRSVAWPVLIVTVGVQFLYHQFILAPMLKNRNGVTLDDDETLIGARGRVLKALDPIGTVQAGGETWTATSDRPVPVGEEVVVLERNGLQLYVESVKRKRAPENGADSLEETP